MNIFYEIGTYFIKFFSLVGGLVTLLINTLRWGIKPPYRFSVIFEQMTSIGVRSLPIVVLTGLFTGMVFAYQVSYGFKLFGAEVYTGGVVALALARELGPVLSSIMVTARSGSAMSAELGTMRVTEQIDALYALAVEPVQYLIFPRVLASVIMMPFLNIIAVIIGILGGYLVAVVGLEINPELYSQYTTTFLKMSDIFNGCAKTVVFGCIFSLVGCYKGFNAKGGALGVGMATTESVVLSCILILMFDYILTAVMYGA